MLEYETANRAQNEDEKENQIYNSNVCTSSPGTNLAPAEAPVVPSHPRESLYGFNDGDGSQENINTVPDSSSSSVRQPSRISGNGSKRMSHENSVGHIYIDDPNLYTRGADVEAARYVPRAAGRS